MNVTYPLPKNIGSVSAAMINTYKVKYLFQTLPFLSGLLSWDVNECLVDLEKELAIITEQGLEGEEARYGKL